MKRKEKLFLRTNLLLFATPHEATASDQPCLQSPGGKLSTNNGEVRVGEHQD